MGDDPFSSTEDSHTIIQIEST